MQPSGIRYLKHAQLHLHCCAWRESAAPSTKTDGKLEFAPRQLRLHVPYSVEAPFKQDLEGLAEPSTAELLVWARNVGIKSSKLAPGNHLAVRGLIAAENISPGAVVVAMNRKTTLRVIYNQRTPFPDKVPGETWDQCSQ